MKTAAATIKGFGVMRLIWRGHCLTCKRSIQNEDLLVNPSFEVAG